MTCLLHNWQALPFSHGCISIWWQSGLIFLSFVIPNFRNSAASWLIPMSSWNLKLGYFFNTLFLIKSSFSPGKGHIPKSCVYMTTQRLQTSMLEVYCFFRNISGAMYSSVPALPIIALSFGQNLAVSKSASLTCTYPFSGSIFVKSIFSGLMSRCIISFESK